jgi:hypothetical protein
MVGGDVLELERIGLNVIKLKARIARRRAVAGAQRLHQLEALRLGRERAVELRLVSPVPLEI